jgi:hypothetical protein
MQYRKGYYGFELQSISLEPCPFAPSGAYRRVQHDRRQKSGMTNIGKDLDFPFEHLRRILIIHLTGNLFDCNNLVRILMFRSENLPKRTRSKFVHSPTTTQIKIKGWQIRTPENEERDSRGDRLSLIGRTWRPRRSRDRLAFVWRIRHDFDLCKAL